MPGPCNEPTGSTLDLNCRNFLEPLLLFVKQPLFYLLQVGRHDMLNGYALDLILVYQSLKLCQFLILFSLVLFTLFVLLVHHLYVLLF